MAGSNEISIVYKINSQQLDQANQATVNGTRLAAEAEKQLQAELAKRPGVADKASQAVQPPAGGPLPTGGTSQQQPDKQSGPSQPSLRDLSTDDRTKIAAAVGAQRRELIGLLAADRKTAVGQLGEIDKSLNGLGYRQPPTERAGGPAPNLVESGIGRLAGGLAAAGAATYAFTAVTQYAAVRLQELNSRLTDPYSTKSEKVGAMVEAVPLFGDLFRWSMKLREQGNLALDPDKRDMLQVMQQRLIEGPARGRFNIQVNQARADVRDRSQFAEERKDLVNSFMQALPRLRDSGPANIDRNTAAGAVAYREQLTILPVKRQVSQAQLNVADLQQKFDSLQMGRNTELTEFEAAKKEAAEASAAARQLQSNRLTPGRTADQPRETEAIRRTVEAQARMEASAARIEEIGKQQRDIREQQLPAARAAAREAAIGLRSAELDRITSREEYAADRNRSLTFMGVEGRAQSQIAYQVLQQIGIQNAPAGLISEARAFAPRTVDKQADLAGEQFADVARKTVPADYPERLADLRQQADKQREELDNAVVAAAKEMANDAAAQVKTSLKALEEVFKLQLDTKLQELRTERLLDNLKNR